MPREHLSLSGGEAAELTYLLDRLPPPLRIAASIAFGEENISFMYPLLSGQENRGVFWAMVTGTIKNQIKCIEHPIASRRDYPPATRKEKMTLVDLDDYRRQRGEENLAEETTLAVALAIFQNRTHLQEIFGQAGESLPEFRSPNRISKEAMVWCLKELLELVPTREQFLQPKNS